MAKPNQPSQAADSAAPTPPKSPTSGSARSRPAATRSETATFAGRPQPTDAPLDATSKRSESIGSQPSEDDIRMRAYHRYLERGAGPGGDFDDWLEAEKDLKSSR